MLTGGSDAGGTITVAAGVGTAALTLDAGDDRFAGSIKLQSGTAEFTTAGAGSGAITFAPTAGAAAVLQIDQAALSGGAFSGVIHEFGAGAAIDLSGLAFNSDYAFDTVSESGSTLTVSNGTTTDTLTIAGLQKGAVVGSDGHGGTEVFASLADAISVANAATSIGQTNFFILAPGTTNTAALPAIDLASGVSLTIDGEGGALNGENASRGLFVYSGDVTIENLTIENSIAKGGAGAAGAAGGGGGAGLGGGLFVAGTNGSGGLLAGQAVAPDVTLSNVALVHDSAEGGAGGAGSGASGGGGGGGAVGAGSSHAAGGAGGAGFGLASGLGDGGAGAVTSAGGGGGAGLTGGGGGGGAAGGAGGMGGGGGGSPDQSPGAGGFGGGAGNVGGGGGGGLGGDIFVQHGGNLTFAGGVSLSEGAVTGGAGGGNGAAGQAYGQGIFIEGYAIASGENVADTPVQYLTVAPPAGETTTIAGVVTDEPGSNPSAATAGAGGLVIGKGTSFGTVVLAPVNSQGDVVANTFAGGVKIESGTLELTSAGAAGSGPLSFAPAAGADAILRVDQSAMAEAGENFTFAKTIDGFGGQLGHRSEGTDLQFRSRARHCLGERFDADGLQRNPHRHADGGRPALDRRRRRQRRRRRDRSVRLAG